MMLLATALALGRWRWCATSSGNAGTAVAAYAARAGLPCTVFVPASASPGKLAQIRAHGAVVRAIEGSREDVAGAAVAGVESSRCVLRQPRLQPYFLGGD